jgi:hypothetical protein
MFNLSLKEILMYYSGMSPEGARSEDGTVPVWWMPSDLNPVDAFLPRHLLPLRERMVYNRETSKAKTSYPWCQVTLFLFSAHRDLIFFEFLFISSGGSRRPAILLSAGGRLAGPPSPTTLSSLV